MNFCKTCGKLWLLFIIFLLTLTSNPYGQSNNSSENTSDQSLKSSARVNPSSLAMEFSLSLGGNPGRNGKSLPVTITYSSKLWETKIVSSTYSDNDNPQAPPNPRIINDYKTARFMYSHKSNAGWNISLQPPRIILANNFFIERPSSGINLIEGNCVVDEELEVPEDILQVLSNDVENYLSGSSNSHPSTCRTYISRSGSYCDACIYVTSTPGEFELVIRCSTSPGGGGNGGGSGGGSGGGRGSNTAVLSLIKRARIQMPDGSIVEFRKDDVRSQCGFLTAGNTNCQMDSQGSYLSVDGSRMRFENNEVQPNGQTRHVLYLPDGSRYLFPYSNTQNSTVSAAGYREAEEFFDANGNKMTFDRSTRVWTDTKGILISNPFVQETLDQSNPVSATNQTISLPGPSGTTRQAQLIWKTLKTVGCETDTTGSCGESVLENPAQELRYIGSENWGPNSIENANQPSLFQGRQWTEVNGNVVNNFKEYVTGSRIFGETAIRFNPVVLKELILPDGKKYEFRYNIYGEISKIVYPARSVERFVYDAIPPMGYDMADTFDKSNRGVIERKVYLDEQAAATDQPLQRWQYRAELVPVPNVASSYKITVTSPDESYSERFIHRTHSVGYGFSSSIDGLTYSEKVFASPDANGVKRLVSRTLTDWMQDGPLPGGYFQATRDPRPKRKVSIVFENGKALATMSETEYETPGENGSIAPDDRSYFARLNAKQTKSYHFLSLTMSEAENLDISEIKNQFYQSAQVASISQTDYSYDPNYKARGIASRPIETRVLNPANTTDVLAKSQFVYDEAAYFDNNYTTTGWEDPNSLLRGNVTTARTWNKDTNTWIESHTMFDNFGNVRKVWDTSGDPTRFVESEYDPVYKYAYSTKTKAPAPDPTGVHGTTEGSEISRVYDFNTGLLTSVTDANGQTATTDFDALLRPIRINPPVGGSVSETIYNDTPGNIWVKSRQQIDANNWAESTTYFDNLGRAYKSRTKDLQGDVMSQVRFDSFGRVEKTSNPYRVDAGGIPTETIYWSKPRYDNQNRVVETYAPAPDGQTGNSLGTVEFGISTLPNLIGAYTIATDASGRKSRAITGIYGVMRVDEATGKGGTIDQDLGSLASPTQPTYYSYNIKGEMTRITQGSQNRYFLYDSFGRLIRVRQPEQTPNTILATSGNPDNNQWTAGYTYDVFGNVVSVTDAKNITITNFYDKASRTTKRTYSDGTPQVEYYYDGKGLPSAPQFSKGSLTKVTSPVSEDRFTSFDNHGRLLTSEQITDGQVYPFTYKYNLSGGLTEHTYPSGRIVRNFLDTDGGLSSATTKAAGGLLKQVASNFDYSATGSVRKMKLGNGLWETVDVNHLNQLTQVGLGTTATNKNLFKVDYEYGELNTDETTVDTVKNIGMIAKTTTTIPTTSFVQTFKYDAINRLTEAVEKTGTTQNWKQTFGYDRFGNRTQFTQTFGGTTLPNTNLNHPTIDPATNRFTTGQGYVYDFNGNLIQDAEGRSFTFNGDDKQTEVRNTSTNGIIGKYFYDGSGARVKKYVPSTGETTIFVYDAGGALAAEYSTVSPPQNPTTSYLTTDHLGSPRVITDSDGEVISRRDFMPFGEELGVGIGGRTENLKYSYLGTDRVRQRFTGYEKDDETGLDFAEARMYQNRHGRFTAPDPLLASASPGNPQTLNRYIYTGNDPINRTDPSGLSWCRESNGNIKFTGQGVACGSGEQNFDETSSFISQSGRTNNGHYLTAGSVVIFHDNGSVTRIRNPTPEQSAIAQGRSAVSATVNVTTDSASDIASGAALTNTPGVVGTTITTQQPTDVIWPCSKLICDEIREVPRLTEPASAEDMIDFVEDVGTGIGFIPGLGEVGDGLSAIASALKGDTQGVILSIGAMNPFGGQAFGALKLARRLSRGGRYADLTGSVGRQAHHMPADSVTDIAKKDGPAIQMLTKDHMKTSSWGNSSAAKAYRAHVKSLVDSGQMRKAMAAEIRDVRRVGGRGYNPAIREMLDYSKSKGYLRR